MAFVMKVDGLSKEWAGKSIFENVKFEVTEGERVALFGQNGVGKTTLLSGLMDRTTFDSGTVLRRHSVKDWGYLEQHRKVDESITLLNFVRSGNENLSNLKWEIDRLQSQLETKIRPLMIHKESDLDLMDLNTLVEKFSHVHEQYVVDDGYEWELTTEQSLIRLGFQKATWDTPYAKLSGGEKTKAQLALLLVQDPKVLILDEPTNHLDTETLVWLEGWLREYTGSILFVSHDRQFIDEIAHSVLELTPMGIKRYEGGYTEFQTQRELEIKSQQAMYDKQQREKDQLQEAILQYRNWYQKAHDAAGIDFYARKKAEKNSTRFKAKERALERLNERMVKRPSQDPQLQLRFQNNGFEGKSILALHQVSFHYRDTALFHEVNLHIKRGDKTAVVGRNGSGKSTLLQLMIGRLQPNEGVVQRNPSLNIGYFAQELEDLNLSLSVLDTLLGIDGMTQSIARTVLAGFLFSRDDVFKKVGDLSMGERCRVAFVKLYFSGANLLVLDEPTNYLDVYARERIEEALKEYPGAILIVSHDRYLVRKMANSIIHLKPSDSGSETTVTYYVGTYDEYITSKTGSSHIEDIEAHNRIRQLELQLANDMTLDLQGDAEKGVELLQRIKETRRQLELLKQNTF